MVALSDNESINALPTGNWAYDAYGYSYQDIDTHLILKL